MSDASISDDAALATAEKKPQDSANFGSPARLITTTIGIFLISQILVVSLALIFGVLIGNDIEQVRRFLLEDATGRFIVFAAVETLTIALTWLALRRYVKKPFLAIGMSAPKLSHIKWLIGGTLLFYGAVIVVAVILYSLLPQIDLEQQQQLGFSDDSRGPTLIPIFLALVVLAPLAEEILMRGYLFTGLRRTISFLPSALIVSTLFAAAHLQLDSGNPPLWTAAVNTFVLSMVLVYLREKTGSLWPAIGLHVINNAVAFSVRFIFN